MNKIIRSKMTGKYGKIIGITNSKVIVDFTNEGSPIVVSFNDFLKYCDCDKEVVDEINKMKEFADTINQTCNALHNI